MTHVFVFTCCVHNGFCEAALIISPYGWSTAAISTLQSTGITFYPHGCHCARNCYVPTLYKTQWRLAVGLISQTFQRQYMKHLHAGIIVTWWNYWHTSQPIDLLAVIRCFFCQIQEAIQEREPPSTLDWGGLWFGTATANFTIFLLYYVRHIPKKLWWSVMLLTHQHTNWKSTDSNSIIFALCGDNKDLSRISWSHSSLMCGRRMTY